MSRLVEQVKLSLGDHISKFSPSKIVVAISGGADSVALFRATQLALKDFDISLELAHINHQLRGKDSDDDQKFVEKLAATHGVKLHIYSENVAEFAKNNGLSVETAARQVRYKFLDEFKNSALVATAHNANDNAETVLLNLARGTGLAGLCGIPQARGHYIRPLLKVSRSEIEKFLQEIAQDFITDQTNFEEVYTRNNVRHNILPLFLELNPNFLNSIESLTSNLSADENYLQKQAEIGLKIVTKENNIDAKLLANLPQNISYRIIKTLMQSAGVAEFSQVHIGLIQEILSIGGAVNLPGDFFARVQKNVLTIYKNFKK